jgi:hypothetical protein
LRAPRANQTYTPISSRIGRDDTTVPRTDPVAAIVPVAWTLWAFSRVGRVLSFNAVGIVVT